MLALLMCVVLMCVVLLCVAHGHPLYSTV